MPVKSLRFVVFGLLLSVMAWLGGPVAVAQDQDEVERKLTDEQQKEADGLANLLDAVLAGSTLVPAEFTLSWQNHFLKAQEGSSYVPFTVGFAATDVSSPAVTLYFRVVEKTEAESAENAVGAPAEAVHEDVYFIDLGRADAAGRHLIRRAFVAPAGEYDVHVFVKEGGDDGPVKIASLKQSLSVPDFWAGDLITGSVILADRLEPSPPLSPAEQVENPYTLGTIRLVPAADTQFLTKEELSPVFLIYNPQLKDNKPDVTVEYTFHQQAPDGEKYFKKTNPQQFNGQTLPPQFDMSAGHQLVAGQSVPLTAFTDGEYRLEIKIIDNESGKNLTRNVQFTVIVPDP